MSRAWKIALICLGVLILLGALAFWGIWVALGHGALVWEGVGDLFGSSGDGEAAVRYYTRALARQPENASLHLKQGRALAKAGRTKEALAEFARSAELSPGSIGPLLASARVQTSMKDFAAAQKTLKEVLAKAPDSAQAHLEQGRLFLAQKRGASAVPEIEKALDTNPNITSGYFDLGQAYEAADKRDDAIAAYREGASRCDSRCRRRLAALGAPYDGAVSSSGSVSTSTDEEWGTEPSGAAIAGFVGIFFVFYGMMFVFIIALWVLGILAVWDCAHRAFPDPNTRGLWFLLLFLLQWIGAILYYFLIYRRNDPPREVRPTAYQPPPASS